MVAAASPDSEVVELLSLAPEVEAEVELSVAPQAARLRAMAAAQIVATIRFISKFFSLFAVVRLFCVDSAATRPPLFLSLGTILLYRGGLLLSTIGRYNRCKTPVILRHPM